MDLLAGLKTCDVFDIQINWDSDAGVCDRHSEFLCDANIFLADEGDAHAIEIRWGNIEHDVHAVYLSADSLKGATIKQGLWLVDGYTEEELPELIEPMRFRLFSTRPFQESGAKNE